MTTIRIPVVTLDADRRPVTLGWCNAPAPLDYPRAWRVDRPISSAAFYADATLTADDTVAVETHIFHIIALRDGSSSVQRPAVLGERGSPKLAWLPGWTPA